MIIFIEYFVHILVFIVNHILKMSDKNSKLVEYLRNQNYQMAITSYNHSSQSLSDQNILQLSRAFLVNENYKKSFELSYSLVNSTNDKIIYESSLLAIKSKYLLKQQKEAYKIGKNLMESIKSSNAQYGNTQIIRIKQIVDMLEKEQTFVKAMTLNKSEINKFGKRIMEQLQISENQPLAMGMPMFLVSDRWFQNFKTYCGLQRGEMTQYPGIISHFQLIDDKFDSLNDPTPQKQYTNYFVYPTARTRIMSKNCWNMLKQVFTSIHELKRFNISVLGRPSEVITQIFLKKILVCKQNSTRVEEVQISKKQTWGGVLKKLKAAWMTDGNLYTTNIYTAQTIVDSKNLLEEDDTVGKIYYFSKKTINSTAGKPVAQVSSQCGACKQTKRLKLCQCRSVKYCDMDCLKKDRERHRKKCQLQLSHIKQKAAVLQNFHLSQKALGGRKGLVGLKNLGNTCYMNSGLQCLSNTKQLTEYFMSNNFLKDINNSNPLGTKGNLACAYAQLIRQMWGGNQSYLSPFNLKKIIGKFASQFSGFGQQDSQQFISYLIDGLQEDLNMVKNKQNFEIKDQVLPDEQASLMSQQNYAKRIQSYIRNMMVGQYKSTVVCSLCHKKSVCFDPYMLITLPIPALAKQKQVYFVHSDPLFKNMRVLVDYDNETQFGEVRKKIFQMYCLQKMDGNYKKEPKQSLKIQKSSIVTHIVCLDKKQIVEWNIDDAESFGDKVLQLKQDTVVIFYHVSEPARDQQLFQVEIQYQNKRINFPKFMNLNPSMSGKPLAVALSPMFQKFYEKTNYMDLYDGYPELHKNKAIIRLKKQLSMLKCKSQSQKIQAFRQKVLNLQYCLKSYGMTEVLQKNNEWYCNKCKKFVKATKQMEIYKSNKIFVLAFKRFSRGWKIKNSIDFPLQNLNVSPYLISKQDNPVYDLYGVVNHYGTMYGGHYTAYCKNFINQRWYEFDDSRVSEVRTKDVMAARESAYVLFYRQKDL